MTAILFENLDHLPAARIGVWIAHERGQAQLHHGLQRLAHLLTRLLYLGGQWMLNDDQETVDQLFA